MDYTHFLRIEKEKAGGSTNYVVHTVDPKFTLELSPDSDAPDKIGKGVIKRISVPNSWAGDYGKYAQLIGIAQGFFQKAATEAPSGKFRI